MKKKRMLIGAVIVSIAGILIWWRKKDKVKDYSKSPTNDLDDEDDDFEGRNPELEDLD